MNPEYRRHSQEKQTNKQTSRPHVTTNRKSKFATVWRLSACDRCNVATATIAYRHQILLDMDSHKRQHRVLLSFLTFENVCILVIFTLYSSFPIVPTTHVDNPIISPLFYNYIFSTLSPISEVHIYTGSRSFSFILSAFKLRLQLQHQSSPSYTQIFFSFLRF